MKNPRPASLLPLLALAGCLAAGPAHAASKIEGYYEAEFSMERNDSKWHYGSPGANGMPRHYAELKFLSLPADNFETFLKLRAESNRDDDRSPRVDFYTPPWLVAEGHLKLRGSKYEALLFSRQNRFWINDEPLLRLVSDWKFKNDDWGPKAQGVRLDFWDVGPGSGWLGGTIVYSDDGGTFDWQDGLGDQPMGVDSWILRLRPYPFRSLFTGQPGGLGELVAGITFLRKDWTDTSNPEDYRQLHHLMHNTVLAADLAYSPRGLIDTGFFLGPLDLEQSRWTVEMAWSDTPFREEVFGEPNEANTVFAAEVRDIHFRNLPLMDNVIVNAWHYDFGQDFRDYLSGRFDDDREFNRVQNHAEGIWMVPRKAVTAKVSYDHHQKHVADEIGGGLRPSTEWYGELYTEFKNGFKSRFAFKQWRGWDASAEVNDFFTYPEWFAEVSVENFLAKVRLQGRVRDAGTFRQVTAIGFDMNVNLTEKLKGYLRMLNVNEKTEARHTLFAQLKYDIGWGAEFFFEYGDPGQSDNIVYTDWFVDEGNNDNLRDRFKVLVRTWF